VPFNWRDLTPVQMLALDNFVLWVNAKTPYKTPKDYHRGGEEGRRPAR
jgi:tripartite-type tricarboxylate transporter receptor subunit TctC